MIIAMNSSAPTTDPTMSAVSSCDDVVVDDNIVDSLPYVVVLIDTALICAVTQHLACTATIFTIFSCSRAS